MNFLGGLLILIAGMIFGAVICYLITRYKKKTQTAGDLYILPGEDGTATYVAWECEPDNFINEEYVLLKVMRKNNSQE